MKRQALYLGDVALLRQVYPAPVRAELERHLEFIAEPRTPAEMAELGARLADVEVVVASWGMPRLDAALLARLPRLGIVFYGAGSIRSFVTPESWARGVRVVNASGANAIAAAEFSFAQIILALKQAWPLATQTQRDRRFARDFRTVPGTYRSTVGLLALGRIGRLVAERLRTLEVSIVAYDPVADPAEAAALGAQLAGLDEVFAAADVVSCHLPLLPETRRVVRAAHFRAMRPGASFVNTARGAVVAEDEMIAVLRERPDLTALLDVTDPEPPAADSPLFELPNVVLTPHVAGCIGRECCRLGASVAADVARYACAESLANEVTEALAATSA